MSQIFPRRNLPGEAEDWGRRVEKESLVNNRDLAQLTQKVDNGLRANAGQLSLVSRQLNNLFRRATYFTVPDPVSVTGNNTSTPSASRVFAFPSPPMNATALIEVYADWNMAGAAGSCNLFANLRYGSTIISRLERDPTDSVVTGWSDRSTLRFRGLSSVNVVASSTPTFTLTIYRQGFTATSSTETLTNIRAYLTLQAPN